jgi:hypothetical protein
MDIRRRKIKNITKIFHINVIGGDSISIFNCVELLIEVAGIRKRTYLYVTEPSSIRANSYITYIILGLS